MGDPVALSGQAVRLETPGFGHGLGLYHNVRIHRSKGFHALFREGNEGNGAIGIEGEFLHAGGPVEATPVGQHSVVVEHVVMSLEADKAAVDGETVLSFVHDAAAVSPGSVNGGSGGIGHVLRHAAGGIYHVIQAVPFAHPGAFLVAHHHHFPAALGPVRFHGFRAETGRIVKTGDFLVAIGKRNHILIEPAVPAALVAPEEPGRSVVIDENGGVDERKTRCQGAADGIHIGSLRVVGHGYGQGIGPCGSLREAYVPIPLAVAFHGLRCPGAVSLEGPVEGGRGDRRTQIGPVHHVLRAVQQPVLHLEVGGVVFVVVGKEIHGIPVNVRSRIRRIGCTDNRILGR